MSLGEWPQKAAGWRRGGTADLRLFFGDARRCENVRASPDRRSGDANGATVVEGASLLAPRVGEKCASELALYGRKFKPEASVP